MQKSNLLQRVRLGKQLALTKGRKDNELSIFLFFSLQFLQYMSLINFTKSKNKNKLPFPSCSSIEMSWLVYPFKIFHKLWPKWPPNVMLCLQVLSVQLGMVGVTTIYLYVELRMRARVNGQAIHPCFFSPSTDKRKESILSLPVSL